MKIRIDRERMRKSGGELPKMKCVKNVGDGGGGGVIVGEERKVNARKIRC